MSIFAIIFLTIIPAVCALIVNELVCKFVIYQEIIVALAAGFIFLHLTIKESRI